MTQLESHNGYYLWKYIPSSAAGGIFATLFAIATIAHFYRLFSTRTWSCIPFAIGCIFELIGYAARTSAHNQTGALMPYIIQSVLLLVAPALFAASIYMTLGRIIRCVRGEKYSIIRVNWLTKIFVIGDVLSFVVQSGGAGFMVEGDNATTGQNIVVGGLFVQIIMFGLFVVTTTIFHLRMRRYPTTESYNVEAPWKSTLHMLYGVSVLIMIRSIFRVVEYVSGQNGYPLTHEWTVYIFDAVLMLMVTGAFYYWYPSKVIPAPPESAAYSLNTNSKYGEP
ncbi:hypothetical protein BP6252_13689 [Coleophoma cylindrospora]|uniref:RTA1 like protein n=1 Tax=Coleophoma cylindrospora TaxID=1849047 RepID=A0A3D8Q7E4_9HELO|nr:hypothetical protein BP6252_13689 [Coleophoma cylindrospora]